MTSLCNKTAEFIVQFKKKDKNKEHTFSCKTHLGLLLRAAMEQSPGGASVRYVPPPGDQPCLFGIQ